MAEPEMREGSVATIEKDVELGENYSGVVSSLKVHKTEIAATPTKERIEVESKPLYDFVKRVFDIVVALICLTVGLPVYLIMILAIVIDDPGNPFFVQERVGLNGRVFKMVKLRTMRKDAEKIKVNLTEQNEYKSVHFKIENDPRVTKVGRFLRRTSLDETAQVLNLLTGSMTIVGPRPFIPSEQEQLPSDRLQVKPGLSCYWQLADTAKMSDEEQLELDYRYIRERGVGMFDHFIEISVPTAEIGNIAVLQHYALGHAR